MLFNAPVARMLDVNLPAPVVNTYKNMNERRYLQILALPLHIFPVLRYAVSYAGSEMIGNRTSKLANKLDNTIRLPVRYQSQCPVKTFADFDIPHDRCDW